MSPWFNKIHNFQVHVVHKDQTGLLVLQAADEESPGAVPNGTFQRPACGDEWYATAVHNMPSLTWPLLLHCRRLTEGHITWITWNSKRETKTLLRYTVRVCVVKWLTVLCVLVRYQNSPCVSAFGQLLLPCDWHHLRRGGGSRPSRSTDCTGDAILPDYTKNGLKRHA